MNTSVISSTKSAKNPPNLGAGDYRVDDSKFPSAPPLEPPRPLPATVATPRQRPAPPTTERSATLTIDTETGEIFTKTYPEHEFNKTRYKAPTQVEQLDLNKSVETDNFFKYFPIVIYDGAILSGMSRAIAAEKSGTVLLNGVDIIEFDGTREEAERFPDAANFAHRELGPVVRVLTRKSCIAFNCARWLNSFKFQRDSGFRFAAFRRFCNHLARSTLFCGASSHGRQNRLEGGASTSEGGIETARQSETLEYRWVRARVSSRLSEWLEIFVHKKRLWRRSG